MQNEQELRFWNSTEITSYFESKPPDSRIAAFLNRQPEAWVGTRALDLGCGGGRHSELLAASGCELSSLDVNPEMLETTRRRLAGRGLGGDVRYGSILEIPYGDSSFDIVVTTGVLHQAESDKEYDQAIGELSRVLKPGGYVLLNIFTDAVWDETYRELDGEPGTVVTKEGLPMTLLSAKKFDAKMTAANLNLFHSQGEDVKQENTGPRAVYRAFYRKRT